jgi:hypothetical protein
MRGCCVSRFGGESCVRVCLCECVCVCVWVALCHSNLTKILANRESSPPSSSRAFLGIFNNVHI